MQNNKKIDMRVEKTLLSIRKVFEDMIMEMPFENISVKELCQRALINRKTFYCYYSTIDDLLGELQMEIAKDYIEIVKKYNFPENQAELTREFFYFNSRQSPLCERITCSGNYQYIRNRMIKIVEDNTWNKSPYIQKLLPLKRSLITRYVNVATIELYRQWVEDGKKIPLDEMIEMATALICKGTEGFVKSVK